MFIVIMLCLFADVVDVVIPQSAPSTTSSRRLQVQPNNAIAPSTTAASKPPSITTASSVAKCAPKATKPLVPATSVPSVPKTVAAATVAQSRPVKPTMTVAVTPKTPSSGQQSSSSSVTAVVSAIPQTTTSSIAAPSTSSVSVPVATTVVAVTPTTVAMTECFSTTTTTTVHPTHIKTSPIAAKPSEDKPKPMVVISDKTKGSLVSNQEKKCENKPVVSTKSSTKSKKPKILTHVIEGFIIQEASEPFPVSSLCVL